MGEEEEKKKKKKEEEKKTKLEPEASQSVRGLKSDFL
jgi:hypothetical protein